LLLHPACQKYNVEEGTCSDTVGTVHKDHGDDWHIPLRLNFFTILVQVSEQSIIVGTEYFAGNGSELSKDVTWRGSIRASLSSSTELTVWGHQVDIVGADKGLRETDDGGIHALFTVMVCGMFSDISSQLCDLQSVKYHRSHTLISLTKFLLKEPNKTFR